MKLMPLNYIIQTIENEIEEGVQLEEGVTPTVAELLEYHLKENDDNFLMWLFVDYDEPERGDVTSLSDLTEDELAQVEELRQMVKSVKYIAKWKAGNTQGSAEFETVSEALEHAKNCALGNRQAGATASFEVKTDDIYDPDPTIYSAEISANGKVKYHIKDGKFVG